MKFDARWEPHSRRRIELDVAEEVSMVRAELSLHDRNLFLCVLAVIVMSGYDAIATMQHISRGVAVEGNPLMASLIQHHAILFFFVKMAMTASGMMLCYRFSHLPMARLGIRLAASIYGLLSIYHLTIVLFG